MNVPFLLLSGPPGVGKTTVSWQISDQLVQEGGRPALVDLDLLGASWPVPDDDPNNERLKVRNLQAMWQHLQSTGVRCLIAAGVADLVVDTDNHSIPEVARLVRSGAGGWPG